MLYILEAYPKMHSNDDIVTTFVYPDLDEDKMWIQPVLKTELMSQRY